MPRASVLIVIAAASGLVLGALLHGIGDSQSSPPVAGLPDSLETPKAKEPPGPRAVPSGDAAAVVEALTEMVNREIIERQLLAEEVQNLREELVQLQTSISANAAEAGAPQAGGRPDWRRRREVTEQGFLDAGFDSGQAAYLNQITAEAAMQQLYLRDRAVREGWMGSQRYYQERNRIPGSLNALRAELGEEAYDRYLYAVGRPNRVTVRNVMANSAADQSGLQAGDVLYRYAGERLFSRRELRSATRSGQLGEAIPVEVIRDGQPVQLYIPRGPLGVRMELSSNKP